MPLLKSDNSQRIERCRELRVQILNLQNTATQNIRSLTEFSIQTRQLFEAALRDRGLQTPDDALRECLNQLTSNEADEYQRLLDTLCPGGAMQALKELAKLWLWAFFKDRTNSSSDLRYQIRLMQDIMKGCGRFTLHVSATATLANLASTTCAANGLWAGSCIVQFSTCFFGALAVVSAVSLVIDWHKEKHDCGVLKDAIQKLATARFYTKRSAKYVQALVTQAGMLSSIAALVAPQHNAARTIVLETCMTNMQRCIEDITDESILNELADQDDEMKSWTFDDPSLMQMVTIHERRHQLERSFTVV